MKEKKLVSRQSKHRWLSMFWVTIIAFSTMLNVSACFNGQKKIAKDTQENQDNNSNTIASDSINTTVGPFSVQVPTVWTAFSSSETAQLSSQFWEQANQIYQQQSKEIYQQYTENSAKIVDCVAFRIAGEGTFVLSSIQLPPQVDLIPLLKSQIKEKLNFGVSNGYISKNLGMVSINDEQFSGFYAKALGNSGNIQVSGALEHKNLKNTVIQLTLLSPKAWDEAITTECLVAIMKSVELK